MNKDIKKILNTNSGLLLILLLTTSFRLFKTNNKFFAGFYICGLILFAYYLITEKNYNFIENKAFKSIFLIIMISILLAIVYFHLYILIHYSKLHLS